MTVKNTIKDSTWICWKDLLEFSRSKDQLAMLVLMPLVWMVLFGFIFPSNNTVTNQPIAVANVDGANNGTLGYMVYDALKNTNNTNGVPYFALSNATNTSESMALDDIKEEIQNNTIVAGIIIPANLTIVIKNGNQCNITLITDQTNPQMSLMMQGILSQLISYIGTYIAQGEVNATLLHFSVKPINVAPLGADLEGIIPGNPTYFEFMAPGVICMVVMYAIMTGFPRAISYEKDIGTLDGLLVTPINKFAIILGKTLAQTIRGLIQGVIALIVALFLFGVVINGSVGLVFLVLFLCIFSFAGLGILISSFASNETTATTAMTLIAFPMMFLSGVFFPISQMPPFLQPIAKVLPLTYATAALRNVMLLGAGLLAIVPEIIYMAIFGTAFLIIAFPLFKKVIRR